MEIIYKGIVYQCEEINGHIFAPPTLQHLNDDASESSEIIPQDECISYYLSATEIALTNKQKLELIK